MPRCTALRSSRFDGPRRGWTRRTFDPGSAASRRRSRFGSPTAASLIFGGGCVGVRRPVSAATRARDRSHVGPSVADLPMRSRTHPTPRGDDAGRRHARRATPARYRASSRCPHDLIRVRQSTARGSHRSTSRGRASAGTSGSSTSMASGSWSRRIDYAATSAQHRPSSRRSWTRSRSNPDGRV